MSAISESETASKYIERSYASVGTTTTETTRSYISTDWVADRAWQRFVAGAHEHDAQEARDRAGLATAHLRSQHARTLGTAAQLDLRRDPKEVLGALASEHAFTWLDIARMIGVSVPAIRKWRMGGRVTAENAAELAYLSAFSRLLKAQGIRVSAWMSIPMVPGFTVAPKHLYSRENAAKLLDLAADVQDPQHLLDELVPDWRSRYDSHGYEVVRFEDGTYGTVHRSE